MAQHGFHHLHNYIDDLIYTGLPSEIHKSFVFLTELLQELGLDISKKTLVPPSTSLHAWVYKSTQLQELLLNFVTVGLPRDLQSLSGSLLFISKCVPPSRCFLNRMLALL